MAGDSVIGALRAVLGADTASFEDGMKGASKTLDDFSKQAKVAGVAIGAALSGAILGIGASIKGAIDSADQLGKLSQSVGVPVEQLSQLKLAADLSGVSIEALAKGFSILNKNMVDAATNSKTEAARAFQAVGFSVRDAAGNVKNGTQAITELAGKFAGYQDGASKSALATAMFGKAGSALIPLLNTGASGIQEMSDKAKELGIVIDTRTSKAAEAFNDNLAIMNKIWDAIIIQVTANLLPAFQQFSTRLADAAKNGDFARSASDAIASSLSKLSEITLTVITGWERLGVEWKALQEFLQTDIFSGKITENWNKFLDAGKETQLVMAQLHASFEDDPLGTFANDATNASQKIAKASAPIISGAKNIAQALDNFLASKAKQSAGLQAQAEALTMTTSEAEAYRLEQEAITLATEKNIPLTDQLMDKIFNAATAYGQIAEQTKNATNRFNELKQIGESVGQALSSTIQDWVKNGGKFLDVLKNLASKLLDIAFQATVSKPLSNLLGNLFSGGKSPVSSLFGFASGGSFNVGGSGGIDSQLVAFKASPNENVTVSKPGQGDGGGKQMVFAPQYTFAPGMTGTDIAAIKAMVAQSSKDTLAALVRFNRADSNWQWKGT